jgi:hypothetical protein
MNCLNTISLAVLDDNETEAYPVDSGSATYSVLSDRIRSVARTDADGQGTLAFPIPEGIF